MANPSIHAFWHALVFLHCFKLFLFNSPTVLNKSLWEEKKPLYPPVSFQIVGGCWDVMGGRVLRWRWGRPPSCQGLNNDSSGQVRVKGRRVRFHSGPRRSASLVRVTRPRERRRLWIARIWLRFRRRRAPEPCPDPG